MAKYIFGIDLGTTYSCIAYVDETGRATVVKNLEDTNTTPSVVNFASPTQVIVGQIAKDNAVIDPANTVSLVKTLMGKSNFAINYNGKDITPEEVSAYILRKVTEDAAKLLDTEVKDVVITCPAYFGTQERTATRNAGKIAGLNVIEVISEPTAAALYYGTAKTQDEKTILVYDLGGGTFDVTVMKIGNGEIEVICSDGDHQLGGKYWDDAVMKYLTDAFYEATKYEGDFDENSQQDLRNKAEKAKQQLSYRDEVPVALDVSGARARITITRTTFDEITQTLLNQTIIKTDAAIAVAESKGYKIDEILLVGGSTKMPQVPAAIISKYGIEPKILEPDEAVAKGAAIYALCAYELKVRQWRDKDDDKNDDDKNDDTTPPPEEPTVSSTLIPGLGGKVINEVVTVATTKSYAIQAVMNGKETCFNMIKKNNPMPDGKISVTQQFGTLENNQLSVELVVYESDFDDDCFDIDPSFVLGTCSLELNGNLPAGAPIQITFTLNREGILDVTGKDMTTAKEIHTEMKATAGTIMSDDEVIEAKERAKGITVQ